MFLRTDPKSSHNKVLVVANFNTASQSVHLDELSSCILFKRQDIKDIVTGVRMEISEGVLVLDPLSFYWLTE